MSHEFDWLEYLSFAQELATHNFNTCSEEAKLRVMISSAYYSAYWVARNQVENTAYISPSGYYKHEEIREFFRVRSSNSIYRRISSNLNSLFALRVTADYNASATVSQRDADIALSYAKEIIKRVGQLK